MIETRGDAQVCDYCRETDGKDYGIATVGALCRNPNGCRCVEYPFRPSMPPESTLVRRAEIWIGRFCRSAWRSVARAALIFALVAAFDLINRGPFTAGSLALGSITYAIGVTLLDKIYGRRL